MCERERKRVHTCYGMHVVVKEQLLVIVSLLPLWGPGIKSRPSGFAPSTFTL